MTQQFKATPVATSDLGAVAPTKTVVHGGGTMPSLKKTPEGGVEAKPTDLTPGAQDTATKVTTPPAGTGNSEGSVGAAEAGAEVTPAGDEQKPDTSVERLARFRRIEQRAREREQKLLGQQREIEAREAKLKDAEKWVNLPERLKGGSKLEVLQELGVEFKDLLEEALSTPANTPQHDAKVEKLEAKITEIEAHQAEIERAKRQSAEVAAKQDYFRQAGEFIKANQDEFELVHLRGPQANEDFWSMSEAFYQAHGQIPDAVEIIKALEKHYEDEALSIATRSQKLKARLGLPDDSRAGLTPQAKASLDLGSKTAAAAANVVAEGSNNLGKQRPTLGARSTAPIPSPIGPDGRRLTDAERLARAVEWGKQQLGQKR